MSADLTDVPWVDAAEVTLDYAVGSHEWPWPQEFADLIRREPERVAALVLDVGENGVQQPILLGDDGRVWDGHHRILAALLTDQLLPVEYGTGGAS
jgi:hypothetical protein